MVAFGCTCVCVGVCACAFVKKRVCERGCVCGRVCNGERVSVHIGEWVCQCLYSFVHVCSSMGVCMCMPVFVVG